MNPAQSTGSRAPKLYKRQRFLADLLDQIGWDVDAADLQRIIFLHTMQKRSDWYEFTPTGTGPFSYQLAHDLNYLLEKGDAVRAPGLQMGFMDMLGAAPERGQALFERALRESPFHARMVPADQLPADVQDAVRSIRERLSENAG